MDPRPIVADEFRKRAAVLFAVNRHHAKGKPHGPQRLDSDGPGRGPRVTIVVHGECGPALEDKVLNERKFLVMIPSDFGPLGVGVPPR